MSSYRLFQSWEAGRRGKLCKLVQQTDKELISLILVMFDYGVVCVFTVLYSDHLINTNQENEGFLNKKD